MAGNRTCGPQGVDEACVDSATLARTPSQTPGPVGTGVRCELPPACRCTGEEQSHIAMLGDIASFTGDLPSPLQAMWYAPENNEVLKAYIKDSSIRGWVKDAAAYHGVPHALLAVVLQQENGPNATELQKVLQFGERTLTTFGAIVDEVLWDVVPDVISGGSSGFANMSRATLRDAATYTEINYGKNPMPDSVRYRLLGWDQDTRIPGDDWKADLYYCAAHLRQLIDRITGRICHAGAITLDETKGVLGAYNGSGPLAQKYAADAMKTLLDAAAGKATLYFYEK